MTPDRVAASIASFDFLYLSELEQLKIVAPSVRSSDARVHAAQQGGHVLEPLDRHASQRVGVRFQEPVSEHHPHLQHRSAVVRRRAAAGRGADRNAGRRVPSLAGDPAAHARRAVPAARSREARGRQCRRARHQDPDELFLRRARHAGVPLLQPGARQFDHRHGQGDAAVVEELVRSARLPGSLRRHRQPVRAHRHGRPGASRARADRSWLRR